TSPAPTLEFTEGDWARITVHNGLEDEETSLHWHGLLLPNLEDGVPYLTTPTLHPGESREFNFPLKQAGTYWYHSHTGLQEQQGVYGAIVIQPREGRSMAWDREHVVVLSDWTHENPKTVMGTLMSGNHWYSIQKGTAQSIWGAWRAGKLREYFQREKSRMPAMDISDIAYDAFLAGGQENLELEALPGERVLLRFVNAAASSYFHVTSALGPLNVVAADGQPVEPVEIPRLLMGIAETYDVVIEMPAEPARIEVRATSHDVTGHASVWLGHGPDRPANDPPAADLYTMKEAVAAGLASQLEGPGLEAIHRERAFAPYEYLKSPVPTTLVGADDESNVRELTMHLTGDMKRYLWGINGEALFENAVIPVKRDEVLRITFINDTMMHHPMHLHGHFFRVLNRFGEYSPLKHTVDVPPMGRRTIEWVADQDAGDWFFHCHILYHMDAGMARVFSYEELGPDHAPNIPSALMDPRHFMVHGMLMEGMSMGQAMLMRGRNDFYVRWEYADPMHMGMHMGMPMMHHDQEMDLGYSRYIDQNNSWFAAYRLAKMENTDDRGVVGYRHRLPYLVWSTLSLDTRGDARFDLEKMLQLTPRLDMDLAWRYDTATNSEWHATLMFALSREFSLAAMEHSDHGTMLGFGFQF
ncbi:MAG: multicopper oxidase domain-containing protein, partial [Planctomycetota bacterium]